MDEYTSQSQVLQDSQEQDPNSSSRNWMRFWLIVGAAFVFALVVSYGVLFIDFQPDSSSNTKEQIDKVYTYLGSCTISGDLSCQLLDITSDSARLVIVNTAGKTIQVSDMKEIMPKDPLCDTLTVVAPPSKVLTQYTEISIQLYCNTPFASTGEILLQGLSDKNLFEVSSLVVRQ